MRRIETRAIVTLHVGLLALASVGCGGRPGEATASGGGDLTTCSSDTVEGLDVSEWQGTIDWNAVRQSGHAFAFIRVSDGLGHPDATFEANWPAVRAAGLLRAAYQYFRPGEDAVAQADLLLERSGPALAGDLPPALDVETTGGLSPTDLRTAVDAWSARIQEKLGRRPLVYVSPGFGSALAGDSEADPLWEADWTSGCPSVVASFGAWTFWQYSDMGAVAGINAATDLDRYRGSWSDLVVFANAAGSARSPASSDGSDAGSSPSPDPVLPLPPTACPSGDGLYCGGDGVLGIARSLYGCAGGALTLIEECPNGCQPMPAGVNDACR
ncbi:MAG TPA: GH25 family lysozyme [Polyangiaceae bacterium]|nr:GH25 family lysozyme [Polyangiaceae bacterium]